MLSTNPKLCSILHSIDPLNQIEALIKIITASSQKPNDLLLLLRHLYRSATSSIYLLCVVLYKENTTIDPRTQTTHSNANLSSGNVTKVYQYCSVSTSKHEPYCWNSSTTKIPQCSLESSSELFCMCSTIVFRFARCVFFRN